MTGFDGFSAKFSKNGLVLSKSEIAENVKTGKGLDGKDGKLIAHG